MSLLLYSNITKVLLIHRSVGHHLIEHGNLRELLKNKGVLLDDYDNNLGVLTHDDGTTHQNAIAMPGNNTNPDNLAAFFTEWPNILDNYDLIMIKSCYPSSHIKNKAQLAKIKESYDSIITSFGKHQKHLFILTTPPLRPLLTNQTEAQLSSDLADWLVLQKSSSVQVFNFHHALSETEGHFKGMLKRQYHRAWPFDTHPNKKAHQAIAPQIAELF